jgi:hypothetical protein
MEDAAWTPDPRKGLAIPVTHQAVKPGGPLRSTPPGSHIRRELLWPARVGWLEGHRWLRTLATCKRGYLWRRVEGSLLELSCKSYQWDLLLIGLSWAVTAILGSSYRAKIVDEARVNKLEQGSNNMRWRLYLREIQ